MSTLQSPAEVVTMPPSPPWKAAVADALALLDPRGLRASLLNRPPLEREVKQQTRVRSWSVEADTLEIIEDFLHLNIYDILGIVE